MTDREKEALELLDFARFYHSADVVWRKRAQEIGKWTPGEQRITNADIALRRSQIRRAIAIIRYERRKRGEGNPR